MKRREFITLLGGAAAWPLSARAQQAAIPTIGIMLAGSPETLRRVVVEFHKGLKESGFVEGQNVTVEYRFAEGHFDRFAAFASELVRRQVTVLVVSSTNGVQAAKQATPTIPIVFSIGGDPVESGLVASLNRPESNITGVYQFTAGLEAKRFGLLHEMVPKATRVAVLINPNYSESEAQLRDVQQAAPGLGVQLIIARANAILMLRSPHSGGKGLALSWFVLRRS
jgi:putative ABC transport system substrate-binding protein